MKLKTIIEGAQLRFEAGIKDGNRQYVAVFGSISDGIPEEVYQIINDISHGNDQYVPLTQQPHFLGWILYRIKTAQLIVEEIQSDVLSCTSNAFIRFIPDQATQKLVQNFKSRINNRYDSWYSQCLQFLEQLANSQSLTSIMVHQPPTHEDSMRLKKLQSALIKHGYQPIDGGYFKEL